MEGMDKGMRLYTRNTYTGFMGIQTTKGSGQDEYEFESTTAVVYTELLRIFQDKSDDEDESLCGRKVQYK